MNSHPPVEPSRCARKRDKARIFYDILTSIIEHEKEGGSVGITHIQTKVNLPSDRLRTHIKKMSGLGFIQYGKTLNSTEKGRLYVLEYRKIIATLEQFGVL